MPNNVLDLPDESHSCRGLVIIPAHNEEEAIGSLLKYMKAMWSAANIVVVNDGSTDATQGIVDSYGVRQIIHPTNLGYGTAIQTGILYAQRHGYGYAILMDADGQHPPEALTQLSQALIESGSDMVIGSRFRASGSFAGSTVRILGMRFFSMITRWLSGCHVSDTSSGLKAIHARIFDELTRVQFVDYHSEAIIYLAWRGYSIEEVEVTMDSRLGGTSMHNWRSLSVYPLKTALGILVGAVEALRESRSIRKGHPRP